MDSKKNISLPPEIHGKKEAIAKGKAQKQELIILVPGWLDHFHSMSSLEKFLLQANKPAYTFSPQPSNGSMAISDLAQYLKVEIMSVFEETQVPVKLVCFSMGGLIARYSLQKLECAPYCSKLITIATPHMGTMTAYVANQPGFMQMRPTSQWLISLNKNLPKLQTPITSIWSPFDTAIIPSSSSYLPFHKNIKILSPIHALMLKDMRIHKAVLKSLNHYGLTPADS